MKISTIWLMSIIAFVIGAVMVDAEISLACDQDGVPLALKNYLYGQTVTWNCTTNQTVTAIDFSGTAMDASPAASTTTYGVVMVVRDLDDLTTKCNDTNVTVTATNGTHTSVLNIDSWEIFPCWTANTTTISVATVNNFTMDLSPNEHMGQMVVHLDDSLSSSTIGDMVVVLSSGNITLHMIRNVSGSENLTIECSGDLPGVIRCQNVNYLRQDAPFAIGGVTMTGVTLFAIVGAGTLAGLLYRRKKKR